jgi:hypothetical protein
LSVIEVLNTDYLLFVSWTEAVTFVYKVYRDTDLYKKALGLAISFYANNKPKRPTKLSPEQKALKEKITKASKAIQITGRFTSCTVGVLENTTVTSGAQKKITIYDVKTLPMDIHNQRKTLFELKRETATEAVVF